MFTDYFGNYFANWFGDSEDEEPPEPEPEFPPGQTWLYGMWLQERHDTLDPMRVAIHAVGAGLC